MNQKRIIQKNIEIIENLLKQVYKIIRTDEQNVRTNSDKQIKLKVLTNKNYLCIMKKTNYNNRQEIRIMKSYQSINSPKIQSGKMLQND